MKSPIDNNELDTFDSLYRIIKVLRGPDGCPWDKKQTPESLRADLLEECFECIDAIEESSPGHVKEELGDIFLVTAMIACIFEENEEFSINQVFDEISQKLIRRHPHVFAGEKIETPEEVIDRWNEIKRTVEGRDSGASADGGAGSVLDLVPSNLPPLERAYRIQKRVAKKDIGFDWQNIDDVFAKLREEIDELEETFKKDRPQEEKEEELGDCLFSLVNLGRFLKIDPDLALNRTNKKFIRRFAYIEKKMAEKGLSLSADNFSLMDKLWEEAKGNRGNELS